MRLFRFLIISLLLTVSSFYIKGQTTKINFSYVIPEDVNGGTDVSNPFLNSGCALYHRLGPNPTVLSGYNVRTVGSTRMAYRATEYGSLSLYAEGSKNSYYNALLSIEYPFMANRTYQIEIAGLNDHEINSIPPKNRIPSVFWVKLDNSPEIVTNVQNKCEWSSTTFEKKVNRYSKLLADDYFQIHERVLTTKFSVLEPKTALKIIFDPAPRDPKYNFDNIFRLVYVKITEMPYEEEPRTQTVTYNNVPIASLKNESENELYHIDFEYVPISPPRSNNSETITVTVNQWALNPETGYSIILQNYIPVRSSAVRYIHILGSLIDPDPRGSGRQRIPLPASFGDSNYSYEIKDSYVILNSSRLPIDNLEFNIGL